MTLVEILVAIIILGLILIAIFPLITQSLQAVNLSNVISKQLFDTQDSFEVVSVTKDGALLDDGTFIPTSSFAVFSNNTTWVTGMTIEKKDLVRFLASRLGSQSYKYDLNEGYTAEEATYTIEDNSIKKGDSYSVTISGKDNNSYTVASDYHDDGYLIFTLNTSGPNRLTNYASPYLITVTNTTLNEVRANASMTVHLPRAIIAAGANQLLLSSSNIPSNWINTDTNASNWVQINKTINKINKVVNIHNKESLHRDCLVAVADGGAIYLWKDGSNGFEAISKPAGIGNINLNDIIHIPGGVMIVGDNGLVVKGNYQFTDDDITWNWSVIRASGTDWEHSNLNAITYNEDNQEYYLAGDNKLMLKYKNSFDSLTNNKPTLETIPARNTNEPAVYFRPGGEYLKTSSSPVAGNNSRTIFMVVRPMQSVSNITLMTMASSNPAKEFLVLRTDSNGFLAAQYKSSGNVSDIMLKSNSNNFQLTPGNNYIISCRYDAEASSNNMILSLNGTTYEGTLSGSLDTTGSMQLGSASLTSISDIKDFNGYIGDVFVFNTSLPNKPTIERIGWTDHKCAPEQDIVTHYLSVKYGIANNIDKTNKYYRDYNLGSPQPLNSFKWDSGSPYWKDNNNWWPYRPNNQIPVYDFNSLVVWLDTLKSGAFTTNSSSKMIEEWTPRTGGSSYPFKAPPLKALNGVATSESIVLAGGDHQNLFKYNTQNNIITQNNSFNADKYNIGKMLLVEDENENRMILALLNDHNNNANTNYIARIDTNGENALLSSVFTKKLNDLYSYDDSLILVTGNNGTILYSDDQGATWSSSKSGTNWDLLTGCVR